MLTAYIKILTYVLQCVPNTKYKAKKKKNSIEEKLSKEVRDFISKGWLWNSN